MGMAQFPFLVGSTRFINFGGCVWFHPAFVRYGWNFLSAAVENCNPVWRLHQSEAVGGQTRCGRRSSECRI